ncbi:conjugal transfer protein TraF [Ferrimonas marina]|uniref:Plasmid transfer operon, TraF, protein n=1 Tax=Ferrimonas marina TaxID=299255 RepID=A0A1M5T7T6_9GAMM|nr:conjugal transfer protein TraF [Ferrimonas marina]SHH46756.1 plasmid transfer operon, TraF, protein [Ferrimonas marina]
MKYTVRVALAAAVVLSANAGASDLLDARTAAIGGAGVAAGNHLSAPIHNPALVATYGAEDDFAIAFPAFALSLQDEADLLDGIDTFQEAHEQLKAGNPDPNLPQDWADSLIALDGQKANLKGAVGLFVALPNKYLSSNFFMAGQLNAYTRASVDENDITQLDPTNPVVNSYGEVFATAKTDIGIAFAKGIQLADHRIAFGFSPKFQQLHAYNYLVTIDNFDSNNYKNDENSVEDSFFNYDLGMIYEYGEHWRVALAGKDMISRNVISADHGFGGFEYKVERMTTLGTAYDHGRVLITADLDLESRKDIFGQEEKYLRTGVEWQAFRKAAIRAGYAHDLKDTHKDRFTLGLGINIHGPAYLDLVTSYDLDERYGAGIVMSAWF